MLIKEEYKKYLLHCIYLGTYVINGYAKPFEELKIYDDFAEDIYRQYLSSLGYASCKEQVTDRQIADLHDKMYDELNALYEKFISYALSEKINDLITCEG